MRLLLSTLVLLLLNLSSSAQYKMRSVEELVNTKDPGWLLVKGWIDSAKNKVEILPCDTARAKAALYETQVTTRSSLGAIIFSTGGLLVDNGWIRIIGSGSTKLGRTIPGWNHGKSFTTDEEKPAFLLVADDAIGGFFAMNGGGLGKDEGKVYYLAPDNLEWEPLWQNYTDFLLFCFNNNLDEFYEGYRWKNWRKEVDTLGGNRVFNFVPPLWSKEGKNISKNLRAPIPVEEQYSFNTAMRKQLGIKNK